MGKLINIDNGGTLTDICITEGASVWRTKTLTTPFDLSKCFIDGLTKASKLIYGKDDLVALLSSTDHLRYSTTQGTNAVVQRKGPRLGLILRGKRLGFSLRDISEYLSLYDADRTQTAQVQRLVVARTIQVDEISLGYERLHDRRTTDRGVPSVDCGAGCIRRPLHWRPLRTDAYLPACSMPAVASGAAVGPSCWPA